MTRDNSLQQMAEGISKSVLNASDKDLEGFQKIINQTLKVREGHKDLQRMVHNYSNFSNNPNTGIQRTS
ncbi:hypothetical protein [Alteribacillus sp. HJP-4]|uniref:hypothetical protein n=1 Tax=Alteribacillus sp. HJP-4 TaxID=2775394 RepID=UPI0035CCD349